MFSIMERVRNSMAEITYGDGAQWSEWVGAKQRLRINDGTFTNPQDIFYSLKENVDET